MPHLPVNHPVQPYLRVASGLVGLYILVFGVGGLVVSWGRPFFARGDIWALGLKTNPAFSLLSVVAGAVVLAGAVYGRNLDHFINLYGSGVFLLAGMFMMTLLHTPLNLLNFSMTNCTVSFIIGLVLLWAGLYGKTGSREFQEREEVFRQGEVIHGQPRVPAVPPGQQPDAPASRESSGGS